MPKNTATGIIIGLFSTVAGFGFIWHIWWLVGLALLASYAGFVWFAWRESDEFNVSGNEVRNVDQKWLLAKERFLSTNLRSER